MNFSAAIVFIIEIIGTIAFASSGAMVGIRKNMDIFGVNVLGITTAIGGGIIRDLVLGLHPPGTFKNPVYVLSAIITSCLLFLIVYFNKQWIESRWMMRYERIMLTMDAVGLGAFTVIGIHTAVNEAHMTSVFLLIFVGMVTGIGGGMLRDMMAGMTPFVFVKHVYACASLVGAVLCTAVRYFLSNDAAAMVIGAAAVVIIRLLAAHFRWNLPRIRG